MGMCSRRLNDGVLMRDDIGIDFIPTFPTCGEYDRIPLHFQVYGRIA
jgi:hypothetical protein